MGQNAGMECYVKAEDIRKIDLLSFDEREGGSLLDRQTHPVLDCAYFLQEIAAQFADLNERLDGFMSSMVVLSKNIAELNMELQESNKARRFRRIPR